MLLVAQRPQILRQWLAVARGGGVRRFVLERARVGHLLRAVHLLGRVV